MGQPSKIALLPEEMRRELDHRLIGSGFGNLQGLSDWLSEHGHSISKSAIHRYSQEIQLELADIKASTQAALLIGEAVGDEVGALDSAVLRMIQAGIFNALVAQRRAEQELDSETQIKILDKAARASANVTRASVLQKEWANQVREKTEAAAAAVEKITRKGGLSADAANEIRREILGIAA